MEADNGAGADALAGTGAIAGIRGGEVGWDAARSLARSAVPRLGCTEVPLAGTLGRTLARPLVARLPLPGVDTAAMDGYAVRDCPPWLLTGRTLAGEPAGPELAAECAREIATGAPVPPGAQAVIPYECASRSGELVTGEMLAAGANIRQAGEEARPGESLLAAGTRVTPQVLGLAAALGYDTLPVVRRPRLVAIITGDELVRSGLPEPGRVRDAIGPALAGLAGHAGGELAAMTYLPDRGETLAAAVAAASAEIVLVAGSSSVGRADYLHGCLAEMDASVIAGGVACKPGRTQSMWRLPDGRIVIGLPGNPFAAFAAFLTLAAPCCAGFLGEPLRDLQPVDLGLVRAHPQRTRLVPVRFRYGQAEQISYHGSAMLKGLAAAEALAIVPPATDRPGQPRLLPLPT